ncbi:DUF6799 domain-containing protein [Rufibacter ruber]|uniref:DUF6799 domain-containing protein n=1 Tax=Rufibacter ruber TaxID=1783499 RepID=UPI00082D6988|nr:DUF6799 domain-containing protein [Rufibacter ruber]
MKTGTHHFTSMPKRCLQVSGTLLVLALLTAGSALAQGATIQKTESGRTTTPSVTPAREGVIMRNGKPMTILPKGYAPLSQAKTFPNGAQLQPNGQLKTADGQTRLLQDGDRLDLQGNLIKNPVIVQQSTTLTGDTTGFGNQLLHAQALQERIQLLQRKREILEKKNELLQGAVKDKAKTANLQKLDAELAKVQQQLASEEKKRQ